MITTERPSNLDEDLYSCLAKDAGLRAAYMASQRIALSGKTALAEVVAESLVVSDDALVLLIPSDVGQYAAPLARRTPRGRLIGLDRQWLAMRALADRGIVNASRVMAEAQALPFRDRAFDAVVCVLGLHLLEEPENRLRDFAQVTRAGGQLVLVTLTEDQERSHPMSFFPSRGAFPPHGELVALLVRNGWYIRRDEEVSRGVSLATSEISVAFSRAANSFLFRQSSEGLSRFHDWLEEMAVGARLHITLRWTLICADRS